MMSLPINVILNNDSTEASQSLYLPSGLPIQIDYKGRTYLKAGYIMTSGFDTAVHQGAHAGSSTTSNKGGTERYVRIQLA